MTVNPNLDCQITKFEAASGRLWRPYCSTGTWNEDRPFFTRDINGKSTTQRALMRFDLTEFRKRRRVLAASLALYHSNEYEALPETVRLYAVHRIGTAQRRGLNEPMKQIGLNQVDPSAPKVPKLNPRPMAKFLSGGPSPARACGGW